MEVSVPLGLVIFSAVLVRFLVGFIAGGKEEA